MGSVRRTTMLPRPPDLHRFAQQTLSSQSQENYPRKSNVYGTGNKILVSQSSYVPSRMEG